VVHGLLTGVRTRAIAVLDEANENPSALRFTARYVVIDAQR
jgi:hypothetical protein